MIVGILGGTGPAGKALAARLASVGLDVEIGSRQRERAHSLASIDDKHLSCDSLRASACGE